MVQLNFAPFDTLYIDEINIGSKSIWVLGILAIANISFIAILYKELKISTFDTSLAVSVGLMPILIHYLLMIMVATRSCLPLNLLVLSWLLHFS